MTILGNCALFAIKHVHEMERLYWNRSEDLEGLDNAEAVLQKMTLVGDAANRQVAEFLETYCAPVIEERFNGVVKLTRYGKKLEDTWGLKYKGTLKGGKRFEVGVYFDPHRRALMPWVWYGSSSRRRQDGMARILGIPSDSMCFGVGTLGLGEIRIPVPESLEEPLECGGLIDELRQAFSVLTKAKIAEIAAC